MSLSSDSAFPTRRNVQSSALLCLTSPYSGRRMHAFPTNPHEPASINKRHIHCHLYRGIRVLTSLLTSSFQTVWQMSEAKLGPAPPPPENGNLVDPAKDDPKVGSSDEQVVMYLHPD